MPPGKVIGGVFFVDVAEFVVVTIFVVFLLVVASPLGDLSRDSAIGILHSGVSLHIQAIESAAEVNPQPYWNSLGVTLPLSAENSKIPNVIKVRQYDESANEQYALCMRHLGEVNPAKCYLEHLHDVGLIMNGSSMSILASITPAVYLITLFIIYLLMLVQWWCAMLSRLSNYLKGYKQSGQTPGGRLSSEVKTQAIKYHKFVCYFFFFFMFGDCSFN